MTSTKQTDDTDKQTAILPTSIGQPINIDILKAIRRQALMHF